MSASRSRSVSAISRAADEAQIELWDQTMQAVELKAYAAGIQTALVICRSNPHASASELAAKILLAGTHGEGAEIVPALPPDVGDEEIEVVLDLVED